MSFHFTSFCRYYVNFVSTSCLNALSSLLGDPSEWTHLDVNNKPLPPQLLLIGAKLRPGLSPRNIASRIISRQSEAGAPVGDIFSENFIQDEGISIEDFD